jgi:hypothetical protein
LTASSTKNSFPAEAYSLLIPSPLAEREKSAELFFYKSAVTRNEYLVYVRIPLCFLINEGRLGSEPNVELNCRLYKKKLPDQSD